ncbi:hypothetical protein CRYUN_Cryun06bG0124300 [Craigia yunnanensis]
MGIALAFSTLALSSVLVYFIYLFRRYLPSLIHKSTIFNYVILIATHLEWACDFWLCYCLFPNYNYVPNLPAEIGAGQRAGDYEWKRAASADAGIECPVCLFKVEQGEEIGELRCGHVFHSYRDRTDGGYDDKMMFLC